MENSRLKPITLQEFLCEEGVEQAGQFMKLAVLKSWVVPGEDRLSYTTIVRIIECCREFHWINDVSPYIEGSLDSITKLVNCEFKSPILIGEKVFVVYQIMEVREKSYTIRFELKNESSGTSHSSIDLVCVFYDPVERKAVHPPDIILDRLRMKAGESNNFTKPSE